MTIKRIRIKIEIQNKSYFLLNDKIEKKNHLKKSPNKIIKRMKVKMKTKKNMVNWDWRMKLKTNKTSIKGSRIKIKNQKNKN